MKIADKKQAEYQPEFSTAGFYLPENSPREVYNFNVGWRFWRGSVENGHLPNLDDSDWELVNTPHTVGLVPEECSGTINYQGEVWYRKHVDIPADMSGKKIFLNFEAIMGKSRIWINGHLVKENFEGYLTIPLDATDFLRPGERNLVVVLADNSDDPTFPAGKTQSELGMTYDGGIYRDVWLYTTEPVYVTDNNLADEVAGGGLFVRYEELSKDFVTVKVQAHIANDSAQQQIVTAHLSLINKAGETVANSSGEVELAAGRAKHLDQQMKVIKPDLWHPDAPHLYDLQVRLCGAGGNELDSLIIKIGIRKIEFRGAAGLYINNEAFEDKLIGVNRHQYHAYIGNAMTNNMHWRDVQLIRNAGIRSIRTGHYPQDPAFMDAADQLGMLLLEPSIGWQFWNSEPVFAERAKRNVRNLVRRDRNRAAVMVFEPALNETYIPRDFAREIHEIVHEEFPYKSTYVPADSYYEHNQFSDIIYAHPNEVSDGEMKDGLMVLNRFPDKSFYTREWGDNVDDWNSQNSTSRIHRSWGEQAQLIQAMHYGLGSKTITDVFTTNIDVFYKTPRQHVGGALWHVFDHQQGSSVDNFQGGIMDAFRQKKYSYYMFESQRDPKVTLEKAESGYSMFIAHQLSPASSRDITVMTNADQVRLTVFGTDLGVKQVRNSEPGIPFIPAVFENAFDFMEMKHLHRAERFDEACIVAEGLVDGEVVIREVKYPSKRPTRIKLTLANEGVPLVADGSDIITVIAGVVDQDGTIKRLTRHKIKFTVLGEGELIGDESIDANPRHLEWGTAPALIRASHRAGEIRVQAEVVHAGVHSIIQDELVINTVPAAQPLLYGEAPEVAEDKQMIRERVEAFHQDREVREGRLGYLRERLRSMEDQQSECGESKGQ